MDERLHVHFRPDLLRAPRYPGDHKGSPTERSADQEREWLNLLGRAEILFDFDQTHLDDLPDVAPMVRWVQATSAGIGQFVKKMRYQERMPAAIFTTASGVHAQPLAEFAVMGMLLHSRRLIHMLDAQRKKHWERFAGTDLAGRKVVVVGLGSIGCRIAEVASALGMIVWATRRNPEKTAPKVPVERVGTTADLDGFLKSADFLVLAAPHTDETERMIGVHQIQALNRGSLIINVSRGALVDEAALVEGLLSGHLGGACLDVFEKEPLPADSPLWDMPNVVVSPHSGSTSDRENARITQLFCSNLRRYLDGRRLLNVLNIDRLY